MSISVSTNSVGLPILRRDTFQLSSEVWSDDFENVTTTLGEWIIDGFNRSEPEFSYTPNVTLSDGLLYSNGPEINVLTHNSTTATGTWSFDVFQGESDSIYTMIFFMSPQWYDFSNSLEGYTLAIFSDEHILGYMQSSPAGAVLIPLDETSTTITSEWRHIDITRQSDDMMYVYIDGVLWLQAENSRHHSSEYFRLWAHNETIFDNVTVSDSIDIDRVPPHWTEPIINHTINYGEDFSHSLFADDYAGLDTWWMNDTWLFEMSDEGVVASVEPLQVGDYGVEVYVNDTFGNVLSGAFNVEVLPLPTNSTTPTGTSTEPIPLNPYTLTLLGAAGVAWVVAVIFIFRDYRKRKNV